MAMYPIDEQEETIKGLIARDWFPNYEYTQIGRIDFAISRLAANRQTDLFFNADESKQYFLWAEAKRGTKADIKESFVQLILTIGKEHTYETHLPPLYLGAMDAEKIAFIDYAMIAPVFTQNDFNWNVTPSNHTTKEFKQLEQMVSNALDKYRLQFYFDQDNTELKKWIKKAFRLGKGKNIPRIEITKNNFTTVYYKWLKIVKPTITMNWEKLTKKGIIDADFYLADLLSEEKENGFETLKASLYVILKFDHYEYGRQIIRENDGETSHLIKEARFNDGQKAYSLFWSIYRRPPRKDFWAYIIDRRDLLVPQDLRERKGSYFTPQIWVEKSQDFLSKILGENWQDEYIIWDCCAGTGNLLNGLVNKYNIFASTIDQADVDVMKDRIKNGANLLESHVFQFDFLNDSFDAENLYTHERKMPEQLLKILNDKERRKKLLIYINPPYAEADNRIGTGRTDIAVSGIQKKYADFMGYTKREIYIQFLTRIYLEIPDSKIGLFSKLKHIQAPRFKDFRINFKGKLVQLFIVPANTFDNVSGQFPIAFQLWDLAEESNYQSLPDENVFDKKGNYIGKQKLICYDYHRLINDWLKQYRGSKTIEGSIGTGIAIASDFQNKRTVRIEKPYQVVKADNHNWQITSANLFPSCIYLSVRLSINPEWFNDRENFLFPSFDVLDDKELCSDCLINMIFSPQNKISYNDGKNDWIPFSENEVSPKESYDSHFMIDILKKLDLTDKAVNVMNAGRELWRYYHAQDNSEPNASYYDIRLFFQGTNEKGHMNPTSRDQTYINLLSNLKNATFNLEENIRPKIYKYGFLLG